MIKLLRTREAARILRVSEMHIRNLIKSGKIKAYKEGRKGGYRILEAHVHEYVEGKIAEWGE